jgi:hypothetical protein
MQHEIKFWIYKLIVIPILWVLNKFGLFKGYQ